MTGRSVSQLLRPREQRRQPLKFQRAEKTPVKILERPQALQSRRRVRLGRRRALWFSIIPFSFIKGRFGCERKPRLKQGSEERNGQTLIMISTFCNVCARACLYGKSSGNPRKPTETRGNPCGNPCGNPRKPCGNPTETLRKPHGNIAEAPRKPRRKNLEHLLGKLLLRNSLNLIAEEA